jgi:hypothetical protein
MAVDVHHPGNDVRSNNCTRWRLRCGTDWQYAHERTVGVDLQPRANVFAETIEHFTNEVHVILP